MRFTFFLERRKYFLFCHNYIFAVLYMSHWHARKRNIRYWQRQIVVDCAELLRQYRNFPLSLLPLLLLWRPEMATGEAWVVRVIHECWAQCTLLEGNSKFPVNYWAESKNYQADFICASIFSHFRGTEQTLVLTILH